MISLFIIGFLLALLVAFASRILLVYSGNREKSSTYECGFEAFSSQRGQIDLNFSIIAVIFIVFDIEGAYLYPWVLVADRIGTPGFMGMLDFILELVVIFIFVWVSGSLNLISRQDNK